MKFLERTVIVVHDDRIDALSITRRTGESAYIGNLIVEFGDWTTWKPAFSGFIEDMRRLTGRRSLAVVFRIASTQVRSIDGLPQSSDTRAIRQVIASTPFRYVPRRFSDVIVSDVMLRAPGEVTVAFADLNTVRRIAEVCVEKKCNLRSISAAIDPIPVSGLDADRIGLADITRVVAKALPFARSEWRSGKTTSKAEWRPHSLAVGVAMLLLSAAATAPVWQMLRANQNIRRSISNASQVALARQRELRLDSLSHPLQQLRVISGQAIHPLLILDIIGEALGSDGRLLSFAADSTAIETTILAPSLVPFLRRLERNSDIRDVTVIGGIAHDSTERGSGERALIRFSYRSVAPGGQRAKELR